MKWKKTFFTVIKPLVRACQLKWFFLLQCNLPHNNVNEVFLLERGLMTHNPLVRPKVSFVLFVTGNAQKFFFHWKNWFCGHKWSLDCTIELIIIFSPYHKVIRWLTDFLWISQFFCDKPLLQNEKKYPFMVVIILLWLEKYYSSLNKNNLV